MAPQVLQKVSWQLVPFHRFIHRGSDNSCSTYVCTYWCLKQKYLGKKTVFFSILLKYLPFKYPAAYENVYSLFTRCIWIIELKLIHTNTHTHRRRFIIKMPAPMKDAIIDYWYCISEFCVQRAHNVRDLTTINSSDTDKSCYNYRDNNFFEKINKKTKKQVWHCFTNCCYVASW